ncbi:MAG TPA: MFS transporter [Caulobacteraceae bacterium]|jgi:MFS family permease|nr:MFS transporter [Caulobacteraceae bacterium]
MSGDATAPARRTSAFRSLRNPNYRLWISGAVVSDTGTWIQRIAQDWLVLTQLTHHSATAVGVVIALQMLPAFLLLPLAGFASDRFDRRKVLLVTQAALGLLALGLGLLTVFGMVRLWHVWIFALLSGCVSSFDAPARHTFAAELVGEEDLANAVSLNSTSFNLARLTGPAVAGVLIGAVGSGPAFLINAASFGAVLCSLFLIQVKHLHRGAKAARGAGGMIDGFRYVWRRPDLRAVLIMMFVFGALALNLPIYISTMTVTVFHGGADRYGLLTSVMAIGSIAGAMLTARMPRPGMVLLMSSGALFGLGFALAALAPNVWTFGVSLAIAGAAAVALTTASSSFMQLVTEPAMRGRVIGIRIAVATLGGPVGAPLAGWVADAFGPRWACCLAAGSGVLAAAVALAYLVRRRGLRLSVTSGRPHFSLDAPSAGSGA